MDAEACREDGVLEELDEEGGCAALGARRRPDLDELLSMEKREDVEEDEEVVDDEAEVEGVSFCPSRSFRS